jgi:hypothetical protein
VTNYRVLCVVLKYPSEHRHILEVGTGNDPDKAATTRWTVAQVLASMLQQNTFFTQAPGSVEPAWVYPDTCECGRPTIRTRPNDTTEDNLDNLPDCGWRPIP